MSSTTSNLTNINFMSKTRFDSLTEINDDELYAVKMDGLSGEELINQNPNGEPVKVWTGTKAEYDALEKENWFAWTVDDTTYYTKSATPQVGDTIYDSNKQNTGKTVSAVSSNTISWTEIDTRSITFISTGEWQHNLPYSEDHIYINGVDVPTRTYDAFSYTWDDIPVGSTVTLMIVHGSGSYRYRETENSSNTDYIPNGLKARDSSVSHTFTMPDEDLSFGLYGYPD